MEAGKKEIKEGTKARKKDRKQGRKIWKGKDGRGRVGAVGWT
jgi:hypothetical protein